MGRTAYAEERLHAYLTSLSISDKYVIGLILGQSTDQKDYVVHLAKTPPPLMKNVVEETLISSPSNVPEDASENYINSVKDIQEGWVADHAKHVTRMLSGGMCVLGIFIVGPEDIFAGSSNSRKLRSIINEIQRSLSSNKYLRGNNTEEKLILGLNTVTQKYSCKAVDSDKSGLFNVVDWKFQSKPIKWHQLEALVDFDRLFFITSNKDPATLKQQLQDILENVSATIDKALIVIDNKVRSPFETLEELTRKGKDEKGSKTSEKSNEKSLQIHLYIPCQSEEKQSDVRIASCSTSIRLVGQLVSRTFVHQKATVEEAYYAVKQDIIRSLGSRLEMHWDSLIEEESGSPEENITLHEPPRRVLITMPESKVTLSDYLFPGEGPQEALLSMQELLDLEVQESNVQKDIELQADPMEFYCQNESESKPLDNCKNSCGTAQIITYMTGFGIALIILIIALLIHRLD